MLIRTIKYALAATWNFKLTFRSRSVYIDSQQLSIDKFLLASALKAKWKVSNCRAFGCMSEVNQKKM